MSDAIRNRLPSPNPERNVAESVEAAGDQLSARRRRADAELNYSRIVEAAVELLAQSPTPSVDQIAAAAGVSRATVYRHFSNRSGLLRVAHRQALDALLSSPSSSPTAGEEEDATLENGVAELLNQVPPHLLGDQIVAEARRLDGVSSAAMYLVDIDGSRLLRFAGSEDFAAELPAPLTVGPEIPRDGIANLRRMLQEELPGSTAAPMYLRGRAIGLLLAVDADPLELAQLARDAAPVIDLAETYTDVIAIARRRKPITAAGEIQQNLLPPRLTQITGAALAGNVLPSYDVGGDWFDYAENYDGSWIAVADANGKGASAASLGALALGAFRAARRSGATHEQVAGEMHEAISAVNDPCATVTAILGRWHGPTSTFSWINCGHPPPALISTDDELRTLDGPDAGALGAADSPRGWAATSIRVSAGERLVLYADGVTDRQTLPGDRFGLAGIRDAIHGARSSSAAATVKAIEERLLAASTEPLQDDATLLVLVPTESAQPTPRRDPG